MTAVFLVPEGLRHAVSGSCRADCAHHYKGRSVQKAARQNRQKEHPGQLASHDSTVKAVTATFQLEDVTDSFPPEMGKDVLVQSSFRVTASRVSTSLAHEPFYINRVPQARSCRF